MLTTYEAGVLEDLVLGLLLAPQVGKSVDDHTEDEVEHNNDNDEEEQHVVNDSGSIKWLVNRRSSKNVSDSTTIPKTLVEGCNKAYKQCITCTLFAGICIGARLICWIYKFLVMI